MVSLRGSVFGRSLSVAIFTGLILASGGAGAGFHEDANLCLATADRVKRSEDVSPEEKSAAHEACLRALAATGNIVQKYHLQEADFDIMGTRPGQ